MQKTKGWMQFAAMATFALAAVTSQALDMATGSITRPSAQGIAPSDSLDLKKQEERPKPTTDFPSWRLGSGVKVQPLFSGLVGGGVKLKIIL